MAQASNTAGKFKLSINRTNEPALFLEWLSTRTENINPIYRVVNRAEAFDVEMRLNFALHEEAEKFINSKQ